MKNQNLRLHRHFFFLSILPVIAGILLAGCSAIDPGAGSGGSDDFQKKSGNIELDSLTITGNVRYKNAVVLVNGPVVVTDGSTLELVDSELYINGDMLEENNFTIKGSARLRVIRSVVLGEDGYDFFFYAKRKGNATPIVEVLDNSEVNAPFGWIMEDGSTLIAHDSKLGDMVVSEGTYWEVENCSIDMVAFFMNDYENVDFDGLDCCKTYDRLTLEPGGGAELHFTNTYIEWWKMETYGEGHLVVSDSDGFTLGIMSPSDYDNPVNVTLDHITSWDEDDRLNTVFDFGDQTIKFENVFHEVVDIYVAGEDEVTVINTIVNEPQVWEDGRLTVGSPDSETYVAMNTGQAFENGVLIFDSTRMYDNYDCLLQINDDARVIFKNCNVRGLVVEIAGDAVLEFINCTGMRSVEIYQDGGTVIVNGREW